MGAVPVLKRFIDLSLNNEELDYQSDMSTSINLRTAATTIEATAEVMDLIPDLFVGFPCEETWLPIGTKLAGMFKTIVRIQRVCGDRQHQRLRRFDPGKLASQTRRLGAPGGGV